MKVATTMKIIVTTTMDMVLHNGYVRLLVEVPQVLPAFFNKIGFFVG